MSKAAARAAELAPDERVLSLLLLLLEANGPVPRSEIFERIPAYQTDDPTAGERKFERDKDELRSMGVPIITESAPGRRCEPEDEDESSDDDGSGDGEVDGKEKKTEESTYRVRQRDYGVVHIDLDDEERVALILAAEALRGSHGLVYRELADEAIRKLTFDMARLRPPARLGITLPTRAQNARMRKNLETIGTAVEGRKRLTMTYESGGNTTVREVDPYAAVYAGGNWQLVGHCHLRGLPRTFRVDRIRKVKMADRPRTPDFERPANFSLLGYVQRSPWVFQAGDTSQAIDVVLDIGPERAWMADEDFGASATREALPAAAGEERWTRIRFRSGNPGYIITRVLDAAGHMKVVEPASLRAQVREIAAKAVAASAATTSAGGAP